MYIYFSNPQSLILETQWLISETVRLINLTKAKAEFDIFNLGAGERTKLKLYMFSVR